MHLSSAFHLHHPPFSLLQSSSRALVFLSTLSRIRSPHRSFATSSSPNWIEYWNKTGFRPVTKRPRAVVDYKGGFSSDEDEVGTSRSTGTSTMAKIVEKLKKFGYNDESEEPKATLLPEKGSVEDIFYPEDGILPNTRGGLDLDSKGVAKFPWERRLNENEPQYNEDDRRNRSKTALAEQTVPDGELTRLRHMGIRQKSKTRISGAGVTNEIVDLIHEKWKTEEVVRLKCEGPPALNMKRMHEILERKTGGLVIWRSGTSLSLYRGASYEVPKQNSLPNGKRSLIPQRAQTLNPLPRPSQTLDYKNPYENKQEIEPKVKYEDEIDELLDELGPRYTDWPGSGPLPVDADLLPGTIPGYNPPLRVLPYGMKPFLGMKEGTALKRLAKSLPPHFALGRSRQHQGLAMAMIKLWEKSSIAKIVLKRGVQLTTSERMAEDIKKLTGGLLIARNKDFIVFYRGKNFLSSEIAKALVERERLAKSLQDEEEEARLRASMQFGTGTSTGTESGTGIITGTLEETLQMNLKYGKKINKDNIVLEIEMARHAKLVRKLESKLFLAEKKINGAERALMKVEENLKPNEPIREHQSITDEERYMFRKLGLRMNAYLLLGRRGVFDGTVENMHLHWKYRELIKILIKAKNYREVRQIAVSLEAESGGVLVSVDKVSKGYAIIVYRGKEYCRPDRIRPRNLLSKRKALARSIELQRHEALSGHIVRLSNKVKQLKAELTQMERVKDKGDEDLYAKIDQEYSSEEEKASEDNEDNGYLDGDLKSEENIDYSNENNDYDSDSYDENDNENSWHEEILGDVSGF